MGNVLSPALALVSTWVVGVTATAWIAAHSPARMAYGFVVGWWLSCFLSAKMRFPPSALVWAGVGYCIAFLAAWGAGRDWFYHDVGGLPFGYALAFAVLQSFVFVTPVLFNLAVDFVIKRFRRGGS